MKTDPCPPLTSFQQQASLAAYTEEDALRWAYADFDEACKKAIDLNRAGRPGKAHFTLVASSLRVAKAIRDHASVDELSELRLYEPFAPTTNSTTN